MPKTPPSRQMHYVTLLGQDVLSFDGNVLLCKVCEKVVSSDKKSLVKQHIEGANHKALCEKKKESGSTNVVQMKSFLGATGKQSQFHVDLCDALLSADIPLRKLDNEKLSAFLGKYCKQHVPSSITLRLHYIKSIYEGKMEYIRSFVGSKSIWISIDETTDPLGTFVAHSIIGTLETSGSRSFLLHADNLEKTNNSTIAQSFMNALNVLWPNGVHHERVLLFVTDAAPYMRKAANALQVLFPRMKHVTCAAHALHRVAEEARLLFPEVDKLVSNGKKIFLKSAARVTMFRELAPGTPLPPQPVITRWGTWVAAALYYAEHLDTFANVVDSFD
ncbi:uncharacterized protein LOC100898811, partial [Galendromus occidentalis]|uniref:Uncharacterized protein LOC100898811 n=1 Tax=Galendromus occidentalis TaxID=34638 RepID=A0AAJ6QM32_9ACAR